MRRHAHLAEAAAIFEELTSTRSVSWHHGAMKADLVQNPNIGTAGVPRVGEEQHAPTCAIASDGARRASPARRGVPLEGLSSSFLDAHRALADIHLQHAVDEQKRVAMGDDVLIAMY